MNKVSCDIIRDLLPLYIDGVCSESSRGLVDDHLSYCKDCRAAAEQLQREDQYEKYIASERVSVLENHARTERGTAWKAGALIAAILFFPVVIVAGVVLLGGSDDFEVLPMLTSSMLLAASLTAVPLMSKTDKFVRTVIGATASILIIEFFGCLYDNESFAKTGVPTLFGLSVVFLPFIIRSFDLPEPFGSHKVLTVIGWDAVWLMLTILVAGAPGNNGAPFNEGMITSVLLLLVVWTVYAAVKMVRGGYSRPIRITLGAVTLILWFIFFHDLKLMLARGLLDFLLGLNWSLSSIGYYISMAGLGSVLFLGSAFAIFGIVRRIAAEM